MSTQPSLTILVFLTALGLGSVHGSDLDFPSGTWEHPNGTSTSGWDASQSTGSTTLPDGTVASVSVTLVGSAQAASLNLTEIDESYFVGFAFQQVPSQAENSDTLQNYMRIDISFSEQVEIENFVLNDVDFGEVVQVEGWAETPGDPSTGLAAIYSAGNNLDSYSFDGLDGVAPTSSSPVNTTLDEQSNVGFSFDTPIKGLSVYFWSRDDAGVSPGTIGIEGDILIAVAPPRLYYTYDLTNNGNNAVPVDFFDSLPAGMVWDEEYAVVTGKLTGGALVFSNGGRDVSANSMVIHKGANSLTLRTLETSAQGIVYNEATVDPKHPHLDPMVRSATITLP